MPTAASTIATDVLTRLRDPAAQMVATDRPPTTATGNAFVYVMMTIAQQFVNLAERLITNSFSLPLSNNTMLYDMLNVGPTDYAGRVLSVTDNANNEITPMDDHALGRANRSWFTAVSTKILGWAMLGKNMLAVVPGFASAAPAVTLRYTVLTPTVTQADLLSLPDDSIEHVARLTELLCRIKTRQLTKFSDRVKMLANDIDILDKANVVGGKAD